MPENLCIIVGNPFTNGKLCINNVTPQITLRATFHLHKAYNHASNCTNFVQMQNSTGFLQLYIHKPWDHDYTGWTISNGSFHYHRAQCKVPCDLSLTNLDTPWKFMDVALCAFVVINFKLYINHYQFVSHSLFFKLYHVFMILNNSFYNKLVRFW